MRLALAAILTVATATGAWAQSGDAGWPTKQPIRMIVPLQAGSDVVNPSGREREETSHEEHSPPMQTPRHESLGEKQGSPLQRGQNIDTFLHCETPAATVYCYDLSGWRCPLSQATA